MSEKRFLYKNFLEEEVEKRFTKEYDEEWGIYLSDNLTGDWYNINPSHIVDTCNKLWEQVVKLREEKEQLKKKIKPSIYNKKDGDWKWNVDNNTILNIRTGEIFYLRNSGAVENLVHLLNKLEQILSENEKMLQKDLDMITELRRENEQLKKQLELRTESDKYHQRMLLKWLCIDEDEE